MLLVDEADYVLIDEYALKKKRFPKHFATIGLTATETNVQHGIECEYLKVSGYVTFHS